jgi:hypothetical protein
MNLGWCESFLADGTLVMGRGTGQNLFKALMAEDLKIENVKIRIR